MPYLCHLKGFCYIHVRFYSLFPFHNIGLHKSTTWLESVLIEEMSLYLFNVVYFCFMKWFFFSFPPPRKMLHLWTMCMKPNHVACWDSSALNGNIDQVPSSLRFDNIFTKLISVWWSLNYNLVVVCKTCYFSATLPA